MRVGVRTIGDKQAAAGDRRERDAHLQLGVIASAGPLIGVRPGVVENIFALAVGFHIAWGNAGQTAVDLVEQQMMAKPPGVAHGGKRGLEGVKKSVVDQRVVRTPQKNGHSGSIRGREFPLLCWRSDAQGSLKAESPRRLSDRNSGAPAKPARRSDGPAYDRAPAGHESAGPAATASPAASKARKCGRVRPRWARLRSSSRRERGRKVHDGWADAVGDHAARKAWRQGRQGPR